MDLTPSDRAELMGRIQRAAKTICRGRDDYDDTVQDMVLVLMESQAADARFACQAPSFQVKKALWRTLDKRRHQDRIARAARLDDGDADQPWIEMVEGAGPADEAVIEKLMHDDLCGAIVGLAAGADGDPRNILRAELIVRRFYGGQTVAEAGRDMGLPKGTACTYSAQALQQVRQHLETKGWAGSAANTPGPERRPSVREKRQVQYST